jgi:transcriptional regulator with XRE-family HTH domain
MLTATAEPMGTMIRRHRLRLALTQDELAGRAGMCKPYLSLIETNRLNHPPSDEKLRNLEQALGLSSNELVCLAYIQRTPLEVREMLFERAAAQLAGEEAEEGEIAVTSRRSTALKPGAALLSERYGWPDVTDRRCYAARVCDDSMSPAFKPGEIVVFSPGKTVGPGDDCFVRLTDGRTTFHRVFFESANRKAVVRLQPRNQRHRPTIVPANRVKSMHKAVFKYQRIERE